MVVTTLLCVALALAPAPASSPTAEDPEAPQVAASERYRAGRVHRFALGIGYRDLWEEEISLPLLDLSAEGGGLVPTGRFGGLQTAVLGFKGSDGKAYSFRSTDKDPSAVLDPVLRKTIVEAMVQDQMAAQHPGGPLAASVLSSAAGVLTVRPRMVVMPDDPALGEFREEFAGMVGLFFEYPQPQAEGREGFAGATEIIGHEEFYNRLRAGHADRVHAQAFLRARLIDIFLGDFDRHRKQWRWARVPGESRWRPIPEDRDQAFVRYDGLGPRIIKAYVPILQRFGPRYGAIKGLTLHGWEQDRWLLPELSWWDWEREVEHIQASLTDEVIDAAIDALPVEYARLDGARLRAELIKRRERLPKAARRFYEHLSRVVDIRTSDASDVVTVERISHRRTRVEVREQGIDGIPGSMVFRRFFDARDTSEIRLYLDGGDDHVRVIGAKRGITLRIIADAGKKQIDDRAGGGTIVYDASDSAEVRKGLGTRADDRPYDPPPSDAGFVDVEGVPPRDWGSDTIPVPQLGFQSEVGLFVGVEAAHTRYGFRKDPWASKQSLGAGWAFGAGTPRLKYEGAFRFRNSDLVGTADVSFSGIEVLGFYGQGNESSASPDPRVNRARNEKFNATPGLRATFWKDRVSVSAGPQVVLSNTAQGTRLIDVVDPYGSGTFGKVGFETRARLDMRQTLKTGLESLVLPFQDNPAAGYPTRGFVAEVVAQVSPPVWDVDDTYGLLRGSLAGYVSVGPKARITFATRLGGQNNFGQTPYFDYATIGGGGVTKGSATNRGFRPQRFAGDASLYGNLDVRLFIARFKLVVPMDFGLQSFADAGRVFVDGERSRAWHPSGGGGLWFSLLARQNAVSVSVAGSDEGVQVYARFGFHY